MMFVVSGRHDGNPRVGAEETPACHVSLRNMYTHITSMSGQPEQNRTLFFFLAYNVRNLVLFLTGKSTTRTTQTNNQTDTDASS